MFYTDWRNPQCAGEGTDKMDTIAGGGARCRLSRVIEAGPAGLALALAGGLRERGRTRIEAAREIGERGAIAIEYIVVGVVVGLGVTAGAGVVINALTTRAGTLSSSITAIST